jgi:hypothetical protein
LAAFRRITHNARGAILQMGEKTNAIIPVKGSEIVTNSRTAKLVFTSNEDPNNVSFGHGISISYNMVGGGVKVTKINPDEPSTIFLRLQVRKPLNKDEIERPSYYPTYAGLSPEQKWIYLNWLRDISSPVNIGYVFIYYYGLERHLLIGEFELAFDEILYLRKYHRHPSFLSYSGSALLHSSVIRKRMDKLEVLNRSGELIGLGNAELVLAHQLGFDFSISSLIDVSKLIHNVNRRYVNLYPELFRDVLSDCLSTRYGDSYFPFASRYKIEELPKSSDILFANISFPHEIRTPELPSFLDYVPFTDEVRVIFAETHEKVKAVLKENRNRKRSSG